MSEIDSLRLTSSPELGSLETPPAARAKRITVEEVRKLKAQSHKDNTFMANIVRSFSNFWKELAAFFSYSKKRGPTNCQLYGHMPDTMNKDIVPRCRFCNVEIVSVEQLRAKI